MKDFYNVQQINSILIGTFMAYSDYFYKIFTMTEYSYDKYSFLKELGIEKENLGAFYDGKWQSSGT